MKAFVEYHPVKHTIDEVAEGAGINQGGTHDKSFLISLFNNSTQVPCAENYGSKSKQG